MIATANLELGTARPQVLLYVVKGGDIIVGAASDDQSTVGHHL